MAVQLKAYQLAKCCMVLLGVVLTAAAAAAQQPVQASPFEGKAFTRAELLAFHPRWPNPYLSYLPAGAKPDMAYWQARLQLQALERRSLRARVKLLQVVVTEAEPPGVIGGNDLPLFAEPLDGFGVTPQQVPDALVHGHLRAAPTPSGSISEPDGTIPTAHSLLVPSGSRISVAGVIGDGAYGSSGPTPSGDFDFFSFTVQAGQVVELQVRTPDPGGDLDPVLGLYDAGGQLIHWDDNMPLSGFLWNRDCYLSYTAEQDGLLVAAVGGFSGTEEWDMFLADPFDAGSGPGAGSEGTYDLVVGVDAPDPGDVDFYGCYLHEGDVLGATLVGGAGQVALYEVATNRKLVASWGRDLSGNYPDSSPLPGGGVASIAWVIDTAGAYAVGVDRSVFYTDGEYQLELAVRRTPLDQGTTPARQVLFLDFDGAQVDNGLFGVLSGALVTLSPLQAFLQRWGLAPEQEDDLIDEIVAVVEENLSDDLRLRGNNGDFDQSGLVGQFDIELRTSRDHADPFGQADVSRVVVGGTTDELGLVTVAIAQSVDVGNFDTAETAVVLLDLLSEPADNPNSLAGVERAPGVTMLELVGAAIGNIVAHEAGHLFANFHTNRDEGLATIMDRGGDLSVLLGLGEDDVFGTADDVDVDLGPDEYEPLEGLTGEENTLQAVSFGLATSGARARAMVTPVALDFGPLQVGGTATLSLLLGNQGGLELLLSTSTLEGLDAAAFQIVAGEGPALIAPGAARELTLEYAPVDLGPDAGVLRLLTSDPAQSEIEVPLSGQGGVPELVAAPLIWDFGEIVYPPGDARVSRIVTIENQGVGDLVVSAVTLTGNTPERFTTEQDPLPLVVASGQLAQIAVSFQPLGLVGPARALLRLSSNDPDEPYLDVELIGLSTGPDIDVSPGSPYHFGAAPLGRLAYRRFQISNLGQLDLNLTASTLAGESSDEFSIVSGAAPAVVPPDQTHLLQVNWVPQTLGEKHATLTISSNDPDENPVVIELEAVAVAPTIEVEPTSLDFGVVGLYDQHEGAVLVRNTGEASLEVSQLELVGAHPEAYTITQRGDPFVLSPGGETQVRVAFHPIAVALLPAILRLHSNDLEQPVTDVVLDGQGAAPTLQITKSCQVVPQVACSVEVSNPSEVRAFDVLVEDEIPLGLTWVGDSCGAAAPVDGRWSWQLDAMAAGERATCELVFAVDPDLRSAIVNSATVSQRASSPGSVDDAASAVIALQQLRPIPMVTPAWAIGLVVLLLLAGVVVIAGRRS